MSIYPQVEQYGAVYDVRVRVYIKRAVFFHCVRTVFTPDY
jgi:hypothetical protein